MKIPVGKKHMEQLAYWVPTLTSFAGAGALATFYFTDWKVVCRYIPFYGGKFKEE